MSLNSRSDIERVENNLLAGYAMRASQSRGRKYAQTEHPLRTAFQRDRDRIVHSTAFRRMEYKTQVFLPHEGDHFRTRLTHTIEVAQISRTMARCLKVNEDLTEAIALVHDLGHTPFGHAGEDILNELLAEDGGFNHNRQSLRVVDYLEHRYPGHPGLNLTYEVREGIAKHETKIKLTHPDFDLEQKPTLEASLVDLADEIAYNAHDIDDGVRAGLISMDEVRQIGIWSIMARRGGRAFEPDESSHGDTEDLRRFALVRQLVNLVVTDVVNQTMTQIEKLNITDMDSLRSASEKVCQYSPELGLGIKELKTFLKERLYLHPNLARRSAEAKQTIKQLFAVLMSDAELLPDRYREMLSAESRRTVVADYIAGMTDRFAENLLNELRPHL